MTVREEPRYLGLDAPVVKIKPCAPHHAGKTGHLVDSWNHRVRVKLESGERPWMARRYVEVEG